MIKFLRPRIQENYLHWRSPWKLSLKFYFGSRQLLRQNSSLESSGNCGGAAACTQKFFPFLQENCEARSFLFYTITLTCVSRPKVKSHADDIFLRVRSTTPKAEKVCEQARTFSSQATATRTTGRLAELTAIIRFQSSTPTRNFVGSLNTTLESDFGELIKKI